MGQEPLIVPFSPPRIDQRSIDAVAEALRSGWITTGPRTRRFEEMLTAYSGCSASIALNSASAGLELVLRWFGVGPGDEVIVPAYTYAASANVVLHCGARVVFVDAADDFNLDPFAVARAITKRTKVVMAVDIGGWPCDYPALRNILQDPSVQQVFEPETAVQQQLGRILLLADAAHSIGATCYEQPAARQADISVYSFHAVKNLTTAEGGAIILNLPESFDHEATARMFKIKSLHGQNRDAFTKLNTPGWRYDIIEPGFKCNMTDIQAALGITELERYERDMLPRRFEIMEAYQSAFEHYAWARLPVYQDDWRRSSAHLYMLRIRDITEVQRDLIIEKIFGRRVAVNVHFIPLPMMSYYRQAGFRIEDYPVAYANYAAEISLPVYYDLNPGMQTVVIDAVTTAVREVLEA